MKRAAGSVIPVDIVNVKSFTGLPGAKIHLYINTDPGEGMYDYSYD
jgi:hypothetical protein